jgi:hypothetical protein
MPLKHRSNAEYRRYEPKDHQQDRQSATKPVDPTAVERFPKLYNGQCKPSIRKYEGPPVESKRHSSNTSQNSDERDAKEPEWEQKYKCSAENAENLHNLSIGKRRVNVESVGG